MSIKIMGMVWDLNLKMRPSETLVLMKLADNARDNGVAFPSIDHIAKHTKLSRRTVIRTIKQIEDRGLVEIRKKHRHVNVYWLKLWSGEPEFDYCKSCGAIEDPTQSFHILDEHHPDKENYPNKTITLCVICHARNHGNEPTKRHLEAIMFRIPLDMGVSEFLGDILTRKKESTKNLDEDMTPQDVVVDTQTGQDVTPSLKEPLIKPSEREDSWAQTLGVIQNTYYRKTSNKTDWGAYWLSTKFIGHEDGKYRIACESEDQRAWLEDRGKSIAEKMLRGILKKKVEVEFIVAPS